MKKSISTVFVFTTALLFFTGCKVRKMDTSNKVNIVCSIFPEYDWARNILGDDDNATTLTLLEKNGADLHSYQPSETDINTISKCDLLVYVGGKSDTWIKEALQSAENKNIKVINLMDILRENLKEENSDYDEHVWLSIKNAEIICKYFTETVCQLAPDSAERYQTKLNNYLKKLDAMDFSLQAAAQTSKKEALIFCDHFPFRYLLDDYGLAYYAAFSNCPAETEASSETITFLANKLVDIDSNAVVVLEKSDKKIAKAVIGKAKRPTCDTFTMDSMQSVTLRQAFEGTSYINLMQKNLETIQKALK